MWPFRRARSGPPKVGDLLAGKYRVERVLGVGGMGVVVAARHVKLGELVAIKVLQPDAMRGPDDVARFLREGRAASRLKSEHVVRVLDLGELEASVPYLVMEHLEGRDLAAVLHESGPLPVGQAIECVLEACEAIAEAHAVGVVHRDLKPANLFLARTNAGGARIKVLDFGISKLADPAEDLSLTKTRTLMGSPVYMAPEALRSARAADARSDVWALGTILYELLTGVSPFRGETLTELTARILEETPRPPSALRAELPETLDLIVACALEKRPDARFQSVVELARALAPLAGRRGERILEQLERVVRAAEERVRTGANASGPHRASGLDAGDAALGETTLRGWGTTRGAPPTRSRAAVLAVSIVAAVVGIGAVVRLSTSDAGPRPTAPEVAGETNTKASHARPDDDVAVAASSASPEEGAVAAPDLAPSPSVGVVAKPPPKTTKKPLIAPKPKKHPTAGSPYFDDPN